MTGDCVAMETTNLINKLFLQWNQKHGPLRDPWDSLSWWRREEEAKQRENEHNLEHPDHPIRIEVVDTLASNQTIDKIFNIGLLIIPSLFLISAIIWCLSRLFVRVSSLTQQYMEMIALAIVSLAVISFIVFGFIFLLGMCSGYTFQYHYTDQNNGQLSSTYTYTTLTSSPIINNKSS